MQHAVAPVPQRDREHADAARQRRLQPPGGDRGDQRLGVAMPAPLRAVPGRVELGADRTVAELKGRPPVNPQAERQYLIESLKCVKACTVNSESGLMDFVANLKRLAPDVFVVNEEGNLPAKAELCRELGIRYVVLKREPQAGLPVSMNISVSGPQGPVVPAGPHQLSSFGSA